MNKYLEDFYRVSGELAKKYKTNTIWDNIPKLVIASELENILDWEDFENIQLSDSEQERLINIIFKFLIFVEEEISEFVATKIVMYVLLENYNGKFNDFINDCENNYSKVLELFVWRKD